jgi:hypothetical protein
VGVHLKWLLGFLVQCFEALPDHLHVQPVASNPTLTPPGTFAKWMAKWTVEW